MKVKVYKGERGTQRGEREGKAAGEVREEL